MTINTHFNLLTLTDGRKFNLDTHLDSIHMLSDFMKKVIGIKKKHHRIIATKGGQQSVTASLAKKFMPLLRNFADQFSPEYVYSPLITFFFEQYRQHAAYGIQGPLVHSSDVPIFNDFLKTMRENARKVSLKKKHADWESKAKKNQVSLTKFQDDLFKRYARVMVVRLDLNYHAAIFTPEEVSALLQQREIQRMRDLQSYHEGDDLSTPREIVGRVALEEVQKDRERFFANMKGKTSLFRHLVGYVWHIECGREAGYHLHLMLFFDGSKVHKHEHIAQEIGNYWQNEITNGRGYFENCNRKKEKYQDDWALGEINHFDIFKREKLNDALQYFCKTNQMVQVIPYPGCHLFACRVLGGERQTCSGRPRKATSVAQTTMPNM
ncbi:MAG: inovirus Gp2 family protein [Burkholderiaceae bacterium]|nr:inovirus Gp2 family protein [Burkholderiaceae bacterium]